MTKEDVTCGHGRELFKYRLITGLSVVCLFAALWALAWAYQQHVELLNQGDQVGLQMRRLAVPANQEGRNHEQR
jgi:hypothetical protein